MVQKYYIRKLHFTGNDKMDIGISKNYAKLCLMKWSKDSQVIKFVEETSELNQNLMKYLLYGYNKDWKGEDTDIKAKIQNEIADVIITLNTLIEVFDEPSKFELVSKIDNFISLKILRLMSRLKQ